MKQKKGKQRVVKKVVPSYLCLATIRASNRDLIADPNFLKRFSDGIINAANMKAVGKPRVDSLPSGMANVKSYSINQPLIESILSIDSWPELGDEGYLVVLLHSCKKFKLTTVVNTIEAIFHGSEVIKVTYVDHTVAIKEVLNETLQT